MNLPPLIIHTSVTHKMGTSEQFVFLKMVHKPTVIIANIFSLIMIVMRQFKQ